MAVFVTGAAQASPPTRGHTNGLTEQFDLFFDDDAGRIRSRLDSYRDIGVELLRLHAFRGGKISIYLRVLKDYDFRLKMVLYSSPRQPLTDQYGKTAAQSVNVWHPDSRRLALENSRAILKKLRRSPVWDKVDYVVPSMGPAAELTFPPTWVTGHRQATFWCYGTYAQADFRRSMKHKFVSIDRANKRWGTSFPDWEEVRVLKPGQHSGPYWHDVLTWYRDSKRDFARWHVGEMRKLTDRKIILYIPGQHFTAADWHHAVQTAGKGANARIKTMLDTEFLIQLAAETGCTLQYTGLSRAEAIYISQRARELGYDGPIYGENAGAYGPASSPRGLAEIIRESDFAGIDYTSSRYLFEEDRQTPGYLHQELGDAFLLLNGKHPPKRWTTPPASVKHPDRSIWTVVSELGERRGLHAMYPGNAHPPIVMRKGRSAWQIASPGKGTSQLYFAVQHPDFGMGQTPRVSLLVEYFDEGEGTIELQYDSSDESVKKVVGQPGAFKTHKTKVKLSDNRRWTMAQFQIDDAKFSNRCNARDFRLSISPNAVCIIRSAAITMAE